MPQTIPKKNILLVSGLLTIIALLVVFYGHDGQETHEAELDRRHISAAQNPTQNSGSVSVPSVPARVTEATEASAIDQTEVPTFSDYSNDVRFKASPTRELVRGPKQTLLFPEMRVQERRYEPGTVFEESPLINVSAVIPGDITMSELAESAVEVDVDLDVIEAFLNSNAEYLSLPINADELVLVSIKRTYDRGEHTITLFGNTGERATNETHLVFHDGVMYGTIHEVHPFRVIEFASNGNGRTAIRNLDVGKNIYGTCQAVLEVEGCVACASCSSDSDHSRAVLDNTLTPEILASASADPGAGVVMNSEQVGVSHDEVSHSIDMVITYLPEAAAAVGGISATEAKIVAHVDTVTQLFVNSQINDTAFHLLGTGLETVATGGLVAPTDPADHNTMQTLLGADISGKMTLGGGGSAWTPNGAYVYEGFIFGAAVPASTGSSFPHEICHNFGASHSFGDGGYRNTETSEIHYGWRMRVEGYNYRTVMSYTTNVAVGDNAANSYGPRIGYLSDPDQNYDAAVANGATIAVPLGAATGYNGSSDPYMDASLLYGGRSATFTYSNNGTPGDYTDEAFAYASGGIITNGFDGTYSTLSANNNERVGGRVTIHADYQTRAINQFVIQPNASYDSTEEMVFSVFAGDHHETVEYALYKGGQLIEVLDANAPAYLHSFSYKIPESGLVSGSDYQIAVVPEFGPALLSHSFSLNIFEALPVAYYRLDETSGTTLVDSSGNGHNATLISGILNDSGALNGALEIDADDTNANRGMQIPSTVKEQITDAVTIMFWAYGADSLPRRTSVFTGAGFNIHLPWDNGSIFWDAGGTPDRISISANSADYQAKWNHYAFTKNATTGEMKIYINGVERGSGSGHMSPLDATGLMYFGSAYASGTNAYDGRIDEVQIYNIALGKSKIQDLYNEIIVPSIYWEGTSGDGLWTTAANWSTGAIPATDDVVDISNGDTVGLTSGLNLPTDASINLSNGTLSIEASAHLNLPTGSTLTIRGGHITKDFAADANSANLGMGGNNGVINLESGSIQLTGGGVPTIATSLTADLNVSGGDVDIDVQVFVFSDLTMIGDVASVDIRFLNPLPGSSLNFVLNETGVSPINVIAWASVGSTSITVEGSAYQRGAGTIPLITSTNLLNTSSSITLSGFSDLGLIAQVVQDQTTDDISLILTENLADADGDGYYDWQEDIIGSDPNNGASQFALQASSSATQMTLQWPTANGRSYTIECRDSLAADDAWLVYEEDVSYTEGQDAVVNIPINPLIQKQRFYRIRVSR